MERNKNFNAGGKTDAQLAYEAAMAQNAKNEAPANVATDAKGNPLRDAHGAFVTTDAPASVISAALADANQRAQMDNQGNVTKSTPFYKNKWVLIGAGVVVIGVIVFFVVRKKK
jgi:hypothetical protein